MPLRLRRSCEPLPRHHMEGTNGLQFLVSLVIVRPEVGTESDGLHQESITDEMALVGYQARLHEPSRPPSEVSDRLGKAHDSETDDAVGIEEDRMVLQVAQVPEEAIFRIAAMPRRGLNGSDRQAILIEAMKQNLSVHEFLE